jgi:hypothetical protein
MTPQGRKHCTSRAAGCILSSYVWFVILRPERSRRILSRCECHPFLDSILSSYVWFVILRPEHSRFALEVKLREGLQDLI